MVAGSADCPSSALISLKPRQVMLENNDITKEEKAKKKKKTTMNNIDDESDVKCPEPASDHENQKKIKKKKKKTKNKEFEVTQTLIRSISSYLETKGLSKTLSAFRSEAALDVEGFKSQPLDLEAVFQKYLETSDLPTETNADTLKLQDSYEDLVTENDAELVPKKRKKKTSTNDVNIETDESLLIGVHDVQKLEEPRLKSGKKKKDKWISDSLGDDCKQVVSETLVESAEATVHDRKLVEPSKKSKEKCKDKLTSVNLSESIREEKLSTSKDVIKEKSGDSQFPELGTETDAIEVPPKDKKKKKKEKGKLHCSDSEFTGDANLAESKREENLASEENVVVIEKKGSEKRKRPATEGTESTNDDKFASKGQESSMLDRFKEKNGKGDIASEDEPVEVVKPSKKRKAEMADEFNRKADGAFANDDSGKSGKGDASVKANKKEQNGSAQPKTVNAFKRVKVDEVTYADDRLKDNSYWAKDGAESGYGARAQEVLGQVRGRDFRHEKTKKKRGTYRGGFIDLQTHSIKFQNSDDDE